MNRIYTGICPDCKEWTSVTFEDNGCCNSGCISEGGHITSDDFENDSIIQNVFDLTDLKHNTRSK